MKGIKTLEKIISNYENENPDLINSNYEQEVKAISFSEYNFGLTFLGNNLYRLKRVKLLVNHYRGNVFARSKIRKKLKKVIIDGIPKSQGLWAAIAYAYIVDKKADKEIIEEIENMSYSADEATFLYGGIQYWDSKNNAVQKLQNTLESRINSSLLN